MRCVLHIGIAVVIDLQVRLVRICFYICFLIKKIYSSCEGIMS